MSNPQESCYAVFYTEAIKMGAESETAGRPIYKDVPFVRIMVPGDNTNVIERKATEDDKRRYHQAWAQYERGEAQAMHGTPLEQWPQITKAQVKEAKYLEVHTVEQLAALSDSQCQRLGMGYLELRTKAKAYLTAAADGAAVAQQAAEIERLRAEIADLKALMQQEKRGPGRPKREAVDEAA